MSSEHHFKLLRIPRLSERRMSEILRAILCTGSTITATQIGDKQFMRLKPDWTWAEMIVKIPRKSKYENDLVYPTNVSWFEKINSKSLKQAHHLTRDLHAPLNLTSGIHIHSRYLTSCFFQVKKKTSCFL